MYSAARSPPRWPVPRPSRRSWARKRTCQRMCSGLMVSRATNAGPGSLTDGVLGAPPAAPSAQEGRLKHTTRNAEIILAIPCIVKVSPRRAALVQENAFYDDLQRL